MRNYDLEKFRGKSGIYEILRSDGKKRYIGSSINIKKRMKEHLYRLKGNYHTNPNIQKDWNDGYDFKLRLIEEVDAENLVAREHEILKDFSKDELYNRTFMYTNISYEECKKLWCERIQSRLRIAQNGCWHTTYKTHCSGYSFIAYKGKNYKIHRISYIVHNNKFPEIVGHICNNKLCCNPKHLISTTTRENTKYDFNTRAPKNPLKRLKLYPYRHEIIKMRKKGATYKEIAKALPIDISGYSIGNFCTYIGFSIRKQKNSHDKKTIDKIIELRESGMSFHEIETVTKIDSSMANKLYKRATVNIDDKK